MEAALAAIQVIATAAVLLLLGLIAFRMKLPERKKKWKQCPTCKKWQEAK